jgi:hypothetical protein
MSSQRSWRVLVLGNDGFRHGNVLLLHPPLNQNTKLIPTSDTKVCSRAAKSFYRYLEFLFRYSTRQILLFTYGFALNRLALRMAREILSQNKTEGTKLNSRLLFSEDENRLKKLAPACAGEKQ